MTHEHVVKFTYDEPVKPKLAKKESHKKVKKVQ